MRIPVNKKFWSPEEIKFIQDNFFKLTNQQLATALGLKLTLLRNKCISMGLKRMELEYWTDEQVIFLKENYQSKGDTELTELFKSFWPKNKGWSKKHIEKKRRYLKLKRTEAQKVQIRKGHQSRGVYVTGNERMWKTRGVAPEGEIRFWRLNDSYKFFPVIKVGSEWIHWNRWMWIQSFGPIPDGMNVVFKDGDFTNLIAENLELLSNEDLAKRNSIHRYPEDLRSTMYLTARLDNKIIKLTKKLNNEKQKSGSAGSHVRTAGKA